MLRACFTPKNQELGVTNRYRSRTMDPVYRLEGDVAEYPCVAVEAAVLDAGEGSTACILAPDEVDSGTHGSCSCELSGDLNLACVFPGLVVTLHHLTIVRLT